MLVKYPIIQAPMAGAAANAQLVAAVSNAGALGSLGAAYMIPEKMREEIKAIRHLTDKPFLINLFVPQKVETPSPDDVQAMIDYTNHYRHAANIPDLTQFNLSALSFDDQFEIVLETKPKAFSFVFGVLANEYIQACKQNDIFVIGTATNLSEAMALQEAGVDAICAQGFEAGGHRGVFDPEKDEQIGIDDLITVLANQVKIPLIAAGGLMNGRDIKRVLDKGCTMAQLGTAFLTCDESSIPNSYRQALLQKDAETVITTAFSGRPARGIRNDFITAFGERKPLPFPWQNQLTRDVRSIGAACNSLWAGQHYRDTRPMKAAELIENLISEMMVQ